MLLGQVAQLIGLLGLGGASKGAAIVHLPPNCFGGCTGAVFRSVPGLMILHANYEYLL